MAEEPNNGLVVYTDADGSNENFNEALELEAADSKDEIVKTENRSPSPESYMIEQGKYRCKQCPRFTTHDLEKMQRHHRKVHRGLNPYQCSLCEYSTYNSVLFQEHVWNHQGLKPYKCSYCSHRSVSKKNIKKHERIHRPNNPLRCVKCKYIARHNRSLKRHMEEMHNTDPGVPSGSCVDFKCASCDLDLKSLAAIKKHKKSRRKCKVCAKVFCKLDFEVHLLEHGDANIESLPKPKKTMFSCALCKWSGSHKTKILLHLIHHPNQDLSQCNVDLSVLRKCGILPAVSEED